MALSVHEEAFVKAMILHGNRQRAVREAFPRLETGFEQAALAYMMQNPEIARHIEAGIMYLYREVVSDMKIPAPKPLTIGEKKALLEMIITGERETPAYIATAEGLRVIFVKPGEDDMLDAKRMLRELVQAEKTEWMM